MLVRRKLVSLSLNNRVNLRIVETTTTTTISLGTIMFKREGILTKSSPTTIKEHIQTMEVVGRAI